MSPDPPQESVQRPRRVRTDGRIPPEPDGRTSMYDDRLAALRSEVERLTRERDGYREMAGYAFDYVDAPDGSDRIEEAWYAMKSAIEHWRKTGGPDPRIEAEIDQRAAAERERT